ncbi:hypothetical protein [Rosistilla oblonga]|uniref:hypothetical protein n=1 Tax=Rosistilla oblonga TaxID=2527990 RepID=UPI003A972C03
MSHQTPKTYRGKLPKPDKRGYVRPEIGDKRFTVGNVRNDSQGEMERRRDAVAGLFELQCKQTGKGLWAEPFHGFAKKLASGQRLKLSVSDYARTNAGQASEEAQGLAMFREMGLDIVPDDPVTIARGEAELKKMIDDKVRSALANAMADVEQRFESFPQSLVGTLQRSLPTDPDKLETRTFFDAIDAYRKHLQKTGKRQDNGKPSPSVQNYLDTVNRFKKTMDDLPVWEIDRTKMDEMFGHWRNRPVSSRTGKRIAPDTSKHLMDTLWAVMIWIDEADDWKWSLPKGAMRIRRTPEQLDSDRGKLRTRRISASTYTPDQLAIIASKLDRFGKMILGISVNCAMQPAEIGRLEVDDIYREHPETKQDGDWIVFDRPKTHEYGEWLLWPEVAELARWGQSRSRQLGCERIVVGDDGKPWYREDWKNPEVKFSKWWQHKPSESSRGLGVVTRLNRDDPEFPRLTIKYLRKILPNVLRPTHGKEIADLINARKVDRSGRVAGRDTDRYADRLYDKAADALSGLRVHFKPFLEALKSDQ